MLLTPNTNPDAADDAKAEEAEAAVEAAPHADALTPAEPPDETDGPPPPPSSFPSPATDSSDACGDAFSHTVTRRLLTQHDKTPSHTLCQDAQ